MPSESGYGIQGWGIDSGSDVGPQIIDIDPPTGQLPGSRSQAQATHLRFKVVDLTPDLQEVMIWVKFASFPFTLVIHDGSSFRAPFDGSSTREVIANGYQFDVFYPGGWPSNIELEVKPYDFAGNKA